MPNDGAILTIRPTEFWNRDVGLDFKKFVTGLGKVALLVNAGQFEAASKSLLDAAVEFRPRNPDAQEAAALLVGRSLQCSLVELVDQARPLLLPGIESDQVLKQLDIYLEDCEIGVDLQFLDRPRFPLLDSVGDQCREWLIGAGASANEAGKLVGRLPTIFVEQFHQEWATHPEIYAAIEVYLNMPPARERGRRHAWALSDSRLRHQIDETVLGQPFSLRDTFVPLRAYWAEPKLVRDSRREETNTVVPVFHVVELEEELASWVESNDPHDTVRMISGGPGSGKSSAAKMFAAAMTERDDLRVVWVPLHRLNFSSDLPKALGDYCRDSFTPPEDFLESTDQAILLIFDGLDELAMAGQASQEVARVFVSDVIRLVDRYNSPTSRKLLVLLCGRDVAIQEYAAELRYSRVFHLLGHRPDPAKASHFKPQGLYRQDRRDLWWEARQKSTGGGVSRLPKKLRANRLRDLTSQPLLTVLLSIVEEKLGELNLTTPWALNDLYETLLSDVYERQWGHSHPIHRKLEKTEYLRLLEEIAVGAWHSGEGRHVSWKQIWQRCKDARLSEALKRFSNEAREGVTQLLTAFYFRKTERFAEDGERTFEFTHKSFAEYLVARRIGAVIAVCYADATAHEEDADRGRSTRDLLVTWARLLGPGRMGDNLADLVQGEIRKQTKERLTNWHGTLEAMLRESIHRGLPMEKLGLTSFPEMKRQARRAELALAVSCAAAARGAKERTNIEWQDPDQALDWVYWLSFGQPHRSLLGRRALSYLTLNGQNLDGLWLLNSDLRGVDLRGASIAGASFQGVDLDGSDLRGLRYSSSTTISTRPTGRQPKKINIRGDKQLREIIEDYDRYGMHTAID